MRRVATGPPASVHRAYLRVSAAAHTACCHAAKLYSLELLNHVHLGRDASETSQQTQSSAGEDKSPETLPPTSRSEREGQEAEGPRAKENQGGGHRGVRARESRERVGRERKRLGEMLPGDKTGVVVGNDFVLKSPMIHLKYYDDLCGYITEQTAVAHAVGEGSGLNPVSPSAKIGAVGNLKTPVAGDEDRHLAQRKDVFPKRGLYFACFCSPRSLCACTRGVQAFQQRFCT